MRLRMWDRVELGLHDIATFSQYARSDDIQQVFEKESPEPDGYNTESNQDALNDDKEPVYDAHWVPARYMVMLAWEGLRANGMDKDEIFEKVIVRGIEDAEADYQNVAHGMVESEINLKTLKVPENVEEMDALDKFDRGLSLSGGDIQEIMDRLSEHPDVDEITGKDIDIQGLISKHLLKESDE